VGVPFPGTGRTLGGACLRQLGGESRQRGMLRLRVENMPRTSQSAEIAVARPTRANVADRKATKQAYISHRTACRGSLEKFGGKRGLVARGAL